MAEDDNNSGSAKKLAWNKPLNAAAEDGSVMGANSWPALSVSARAPPKLFYSNASVDMSEEMLLAMALCSRVEGDTTASHESPNGQKSMKRAVYSPNHNSKMAANGSLSPNPSMSGASMEAQQQQNANASELNKEDMQRVSRGRPPNNDVNGPGRNNNGPRPDGVHHHKHSARRDNHRRENFTSQKRDGSRSFVRGPVAPPAPPPLPIIMRPMVNPMVYHELPHVYYVPGPHLNSPRPMHMVSYSPMSFPSYDPNLCTQILNQIEYYFSNENLIKDIFLRQNMNREGWVPVKLIAGFKRVVELTDNLHLILDALKASNVVEVQGDKVRCKNDWNKWLIHNIPSPSGQDNLAAHFNSAALHENAAA